MSRMKPVAIGLSLLSIIPIIPASAAPVTDVDQICTTIGNSQECYPRIFVPTTEFQPVREGQEIPPGLHVRMDIYSGTKEAKLMDPNDPDGDQVVMNSDSSLLIVDQSASGPSEFIDDGPMSAPYTLGPVIVEKALPQTKDFFSALTAITAGDPTGETALDTALESLSDISNDVYYGELLTSDYDIVAALLCFAFDEPSAGISPAGYPRSHTAANILAGALQNNPTVLREVTSKWPRLSAHVCGPERTPLGRRIFHGSIAPKTLSSNATIAAKEGQRVRALASVYGGLLPNAEFRREFLASGGMRHILEVLVREEPALEKAQKRLSQVVMDSFLDEDMGAERGQWPVVAAVMGGEAKKVCEVEETATSEECWDYRLEKITRKNKAEHWSRVLLDALKKERKLGPTKEEL